MNKKNSPQRKTILKWKSNGELSEIDMLRILDKFSSHDLNRSKLTCNFNQDWIYINKIVFIFSSKYKNLSLAGFSTKWSE